MLTYGLYEPHPRLFQHGTGCPSTEMERQAQAEPDAYSASCLELWERKERDPWQPREDPALRNAADWV